MVTGGLAGYNVVRYALGMPLLILPRNTVCGDLIAYANYKMTTEEGRKNRYTFAGAEYFKRMKENNMYSLDKEEIVNRIKKENLYNIFSEKLVYRASLYILGKCVKRQNSLKNCTSFMCLSK